MVKQKSPHKETEASQRVVTGVSIDSTANTTMQVSYNKDLDDDTIEPIISYLEGEMGEIGLATPEHKAAAPNQNYYLRMHAGYIRNK